MIADKDPGQGAKVLSRSGDANDVEVTLTTPLGRTTKYRIERLPTRDEVWTTTHSDGTQVRVQRKPDGSVTSNLPDGTSAIQKLGPDPRFGMLSPVPISLTLRTPGGLVQTQTTQRTASLRNPSDPTSLNSATETFAINGKTFTRIYNGTARTVTIRSPLGRETRATLDDKGRINNIVGPSVTGMQMLYDSLGRPANVAQGARQHTFTFDSSGHADTLSDGLARVIRYDRDPLGRITQIHSPDDSVVSFGFDALSETMSVTPPGRPAHRVERDIVGRVGSYLAPDVGAGTSRTTFNYNVEHQLTDLTAPDGASIHIGYDSAGRPRHITLSEGTIEASYDAAGRLSVLDAPGPVGLAFGYDGGLRTDITWTGPVPGTIHRTFDNNFRVASTSVNGEAAVVAAYDDDGLATRVGALNITRDGPTGRVNQTTVGSVVEAYTFNELGELASSVATCGGVALRAMSVTRDSAGTITTKSETLLGQASAVTYNHDALGRLIGVQDGAGTVTYTPALHNFYAA